MEKGAGTAVGPPDWRSIVAQAFPPPTRNGGSSNGKHSAEDANPPREWLDGEQELLVQYSILPLGRNDGVVHMALADLNNAGLARCLARMQNASALIHLAPRPAIDAALAEAFREEDKHSVSWAHAQSRPDQSASRVLSTPQKIGGAPLIATVIAGLAFKPVETLVVLIAVLTGFYIVSAIYKMSLAIRALASDCETPVSDDDVSELAESDLPTYTVLLPVYKEGQMLHGLIAAVESIDYPKYKLDVKLLMEEDDLETQEAADRESLPDYFQKLVVPRGRPRGKPRACNYGLLYAKGAFCVIFDAEDRPEADQLKKAVVAFRRANEKTICVQAKLGHYNPGQNLLTKWFTAEYLTWFDFYLPGLNAFNAPIPLGGTSNHFRTDLLREVGGWDPFNVTEDADIGIRVAREGWETRVIDSTTYEEANSQLGNWIRQRSRWVKGYMQTWLVHMRNPWRLLREVGPGGFLGIQIMILGTFLVYFANPVMWALTGAWYATHAAGIQDLYPAPLLYCATTALFAGNLIFVYVGVLACLRHDYVSGVKYVLASPIYWLLMSIAAWKGLYELIVKPHYWQKTKHGLTPSAHTNGTPPHVHLTLGSAPAPMVPESVHVID